VYVYHFLLISMVSLEFKVIQVYISPVTPQKMCYPLVSTQQ